jgi:hypothetical protein
VNRVEMEWYVPGVNGWDLVDQPTFNADVNFHPRVDQGQQVRCVECCSQLRSANDIRCEVCSYKHERRTTQAMHCLNVD